jgi:2-polyprenyl-6-methoxyphenol hydroxylase-like FAD-dependent oxidoreductase
MQHWKTSFKINHRIAKNFSIDNVYLGGDAAHVHSPLGARGMNTGFEDAFVFAELMRRGRLQDY